MEVSLLSEAIFPLMNSPVRIAVSEPVFRQVRMPELNFRANSSDFRSEREKLCDWLFGTVGPAACVLTGARAYMAVAKPIKYTISTTKTLFCHPIELFSPHNKFFIGHGAGGYLLSVIASTLYLKIQISGWQIGLRVLRRNEERCNLSNLLLTYVS